MTTGAAFKNLPPHDAHAAMVAKAVALGVPAPKFRPLCEMDGELNMLIINSSLIPTQRKIGIMALDLMEKLNSI